MLHVIKAEATYLLWVDCNALKGDLSDFSDFIRKTSGLYVSDGQEYRQGYGFLRINLACPKSRVEDGMNRLKKSILAWNEKIYDGDETVYAVPFLSMEEQYQNGKDFLGGLTLTQAQKEQYHCD